MSDRDNWKINTPRLMIFEIFNAVTGLPVAGRDLSELTVKIFRNAAVPSPLPSVVLSELGDGRYLATYSPGAFGYWYLGIRDTVYNPQGWTDEINVISVAEDEPVAVSTASITAIATAVFTLPLSTYEAAITGVRCLGAVVQRIRNKVARTGPTTFTVFKSDDVTPAWTETIVTDGNQQPIVSEDPN